MGGQLGVPVSTGIIKQAVARAGQDLGSPTSPKNAPLTPRPTQDRTWRGSGSTWPSRSPLRRRFAAVHSHSQRLLRPLTALAAGHALRPLTANLPRRG